MIAHSDLSMLICLLVGAALAQRCKVFALVPAIAVAVTVLVVGGFGEGATFWQTLGSVLIDVTALQTGYLAGIGIHYFAHSAHIKSERAQSLRSWISRTVN